MDRISSAAAARMREIADRARAARQEGDDPVAQADFRTGMCDARTALCIARGVPLDGIDPASGYDVTLAAYETVRASWRELVEQSGFSEVYTRPRYEAAFGRWAALRPQFTDGDDWLAGLIEPETEGA